MNDNTNNWSPSTNNTAATTTTNNNHNHNNNRRENNNNPNNHDNTTNQAITESEAHTHLSSVITHVNRFNLVHCTLVTAAAASSNNEHLNPTNQHQAHYPISNQFIDSQSNPNNQSGLGGFLSPIQQHHQNQSLNNPHPQSIHQYPNQSIIDQQSLNSHQHHFVMPASRNGQPTTQSIHQTQVNATKKRSGGRRPKDEDSYTQMNLNPMEKRKRVDRRERNRLAAARCRQRRLDLIEQLEAKVEDLQKALSSKQRQMEDMKQQKDQIEAMLKQHNCKMTNPPSIMANTNNNVQIVDVNSTNQFIVPPPQTRASAQRNRQQQHAPNLSNTRHKAANNHNNQDQNMDTAAADPTLTQCNAMDMKPDINELHRPSTLTFPSEYGSTHGVPTTTPSNMFGNGFDVLNPGTGLTPVSSIGLTPVMNTGTTPLETPMGHKSLASL